MRSCYCTQVGTSCRDDAVHMIGFRNGAHCNGSHACFISNSIGKRRLKHAAIHRFFTLVHLSRRAIYKVNTCCFELLGNLNGIVWRDASSTQSCAEMRTDMGLS